MTSLNVPTIDINQLANDPEVISRVGTACADWGFFQVINHGIDPALRARFLHACQAFFHAPEELKRDVLRSADNPMGFFDEELTKNQQDWKQIFDYGADWRDPTADYLSRWPATMPDFEGILLAWFEACEGLSLRLLTAMATALNVDPEILLTSFSPHHTSFARLNYYPLCGNPMCDDPMRDDPQTDSNAGHLGIHPHTDSGALTVLLQDDVAALQVCRQGQWHTIEPAVDGLIINIGDMLQVWSNDHFTAPEHRVLASSQRERFSAPFFFNPANNTDCVPLTGTTPLYQPVNWGQFRQARAAGDYANIGEEIQISQFKH
jgi:isopenicillin N synthase-like dioxygenase